MNRWARLSWNIDEFSPLYPGTSPVRIQQCKSIVAGDSCNTSFISLSSHAGTHVDAPRHFFEEGRSIDDYTPDELSFRSPLVIECPQPPGGIIKITDLPELTTEMNNTDILLIKTGFQVYRARKPEMYRTQNPCLSLEVAIWLKNELPQLRALGFDCISIASVLHREVGREVHRVLLQSGEEGRHPILLIEDMCLPEEYCRFNEILVCPLPVQHGDGAPCVVLGLLAND